MNTPHRKITAGSSGDGRINTQGKKNILTFLSRGSVVKCLSMKWAPDNSCSKLFIPNNTISHHHTQILGCIFQYSIMQHRSFYTTKSVAYFYATADAATTIKIVYVYLCIYTVSQKNAQTLVTKLFLSFVLLFLISLTFII